MRLKLARYGIVPPANVTLRKKMFAHQSEEMFANLLDFYRIAWEYEPRSFPVQWDKDGKRHWKPSRPISTCPNSTSTWN